MSATLALEDLLVCLFAPHELDRFVRRLDGGDEIAARLLADDPAPARAAVVVAGLERRGAVDDALFTALERERPNHAEAIRRTRDEALGARAGAPLVVVRAGRPVARSDLVWFGGFSAHAHRSRVTGLRDLATAVLNLAVLYRAAVVADSDLNDNPGFHLLTDPRYADDHDVGVLRRAIQSGFLVRAARREAGGPVSQAEIHRRFVGANAPEAGAVPPGHAAAVDALFGDSTSIPWETTTVSRAFATRVIAELGLYAPASEDERRVVARVIEWVASQRGHPGLKLTSLRAATLPRWDVPGPEAAVWERVLARYDGNVPLSRGGDLMFLGDSTLPGGPEQDRGESDALRQWLIDRSGRPQGPGRVDGRLPATIRFTAKLGENTFDRVELLRESARPDEYFDLRYRSLGSAAHRAHHHRALASARRGYLGSLRSLLRELGEAPPWLAAFDDELPAPASHDLGCSVQEPNVMVPAAPVGDAPRVALPLLRPNLGAMEAVAEDVLGGKVGRG